MEANKLKVGDKLQDLVFTVTDSFNQQICESVHCNDLYYKNVIHPSLLIGMSNITKSPSYKLAKDVAAIHTQDEIEYIRHGIVGDCIMVTWVVVALYKRRDKHWNDLDYQVVESTVTDANGIILKRRMTDYYIGKIK
jgi:hypothetical protein